LREAGKGGREKRRSRGKCGKEGSRSKMIDKVRR
jgi:hypothetical protein